MDQSFGDSPDTMVTADDRGRIVLVNSQNVARPRPPFRTTVISNEKAVAHGG